MSPQFQHIKSRVFASTSGPWTTRSEVIRGELVPSQIIGQRHVVARLNPYAHRTRAWATFLTSAPEVMRDLINAVEGEGSVPDCESMDATRASYPYTHSVGVIGKRITVPWVHMVFEPPDRGYFKWFADVERDADRAFILNLYSDFSTLKHLAMEKENA